METFEAQVESLTGITISSSGTIPTQAQLTQFLNDGVIDVTNRTLQDRDKIDDDVYEPFQRETSTSDSQGVSVGGAKIIAVLREADSDGSSDGTKAWYPCSKIPVALQSRVIDTESLNFASIYNPVYTVDNDKTINVYPVPSSNDGFKVYYVNEEPRDITNNASLTYAHSNIKYFPNDKVYLVVIYAAIKSLESKRAELVLVEEDSELVQAISYNIQDLQNQYDKAFQATEKIALLTKAGVGAQ